MKFNEYEEIISKTAMYPMVGEGTQMPLAYVSLGLTGESGEFAEKIKKWIRGQDLNKEAAAKELGDVLWYLTAAARELGYSLQDIAQMNMVKLLDRQARGVINSTGDTR
jgi:NTP pyrophosphatase (non-canonical NTP hydrolase)